MGSVTAAFVTLGLALSGCGSGATSSSSSSAPASSGSATSTSSSAAASSSAPSPSAAPASGHVTVPISGYAFHPAKLVVAPGTKVTFANHDQTAHTATAAGSGASGFDSGTIKPGASATVTFRKAGTYAYICQFHAFMHGTVVVK
jgi:plastocyanin